LSPRSEFCSLGVILSYPLNYPLGVNFSIRTSILLNSTQCSSLRGAGGGGERRGEHSPQGTKFTSVGKFTPRGKLNPWGQTMLLKTGLQGSVHKKRIYCHIFSCSEGRIRLGPRVERGSTRQLLLRLHHYPGNRARFLIKTLFRALQIPI
jgi:hypothetical protein